MVGSRVTYRTHKRRSVEKKKKKKDTVSREFSKV